MIMPIAIFINILETFSYSYDHVLQDVFLIQSTMYIHKSVSFIILFPL